MRNLRHLAESEESPDVLDASGKHFSLRSIKHTPRFLHYPFILSGYRVYFSYKLCFWSLFRVHNETGNVWSHLLGFWIFAVLAYRVITWELPGLEHFYFGDLMCAVVFYGSACSCMLFSSIYHLYGCHSARTHVNLYRLDMLGICLLIFGSFYGGLYFGFYCHPHLQIIYIGAIFLLVCACVAATNLPAFQGARFHNIRVVLLTSTVGSCVIPAVHWAAFIARPEDIDLFLWRLLAMLGLYLLGFFFYVSKFPEKMHPGVFDYWGHSHQWWHICVVGAALLWEEGVHQALKVFPARIC